MATDTAPLKKQIHYVGLYPRVLATMVDVSLFAIVLYPLSFALAWLVFGSQSPGHEIEPLLAQSIKGVNSLAELVYNLSANDALWQYVADHHLILKLAIQYIMQVFVILGLIGGFWLYKSATPGKMLLSMHIVDAKTFGTPSRKQYLLRLLGYFVSTVFLLLGFIWIGVNKRKRGWHDIIAGTVVVKS